MQQIFYRRILGACTLALCLLLAPDALGRPFSQQPQQQNGTSGSNVRQRRDVNPFHNTITTTSADGTSRDCFEAVKETLANGTVNRTANVCCKGYGGVNCVEEQPEPTELGSGKPDLDSLDPCKNLVCEGVTDAHCLTITKCGERYPVFLHGDGTIAECTNGQPVNVTELTCTERCASDPCEGQSCSAFPDAFCVHTVCDCNEPMWLLDTGVQVDCETGEHLSPEEAKERRMRRKRRQADPSAADPEPSCS